MKSLSLSHPLVIMVIGLPGSGKSFFARQFATMFGAPLASADYVRHTLFPESQNTAEEDAYVQALQRNQLDELLKTGKTIVLDGGANSRTLRAHVERQAKINSYGTLVVWVQTDEPTSLRRSVKRGNKRQDDALNSPLTADTFKRLKKQFSKPGSFEDTVVISGKHTYSTQARVVLKKLVTPRDTVTVDRPSSPSRIDIQSEPHNDVQPRRHNVTIN